MNRRTADESARSYLARGWSVIPVQAGGKHPMVSWEPFQHRHPEEKEVLGWFRHWPNANLAIVTGEVSALVVLDVDSRHGGDDSLVDLEHRFGTLPVTVEAIGSVR